MAARSSGRGRTVGVPMHGGAVTEEDDPMARKAIVGEKVGMTQIWDEANRLVPGDRPQGRSPFRVVQVKTPEREGYSAAPGHLWRPASRPASTKPEAGHFAAAGVDAGKRLVELRARRPDGYAVGQEIDAGVLERRRQGGRHGR